MHTNSDSGNNRWVELYNNHSCDATRSTLRAKPAGWPGSRAAKTRGANSYVWHRAIALSAARSPSHPTGSLLRSKRRFLAPCLIFIFSRWAKRGWSGDLSDFGGYLILDGTRLTASDTVRAASCENAPASTAQPRECSTV